MRFKTTWIFIAIFAALAAYLYFVEEPRHQAKKEADEKAGLLFPDFDPERVTELSVAGPGGVVRVEKGEEDKWYTVEPWEDRADDGRVRTLLNDLKSLKAEKEVAGSDADLKAFGLEEPEGTVRTEGFEVALFIGAQNPAGDSRYIRSGDGPVQVTKSYSVSAFLEDPKDLRNKDALEGFPWSRLSSISIDPSEGAKIRLAKGDDDVWRLEEPLGAEADPTAADRLADKLRWARVNEFLSEEASKAEEALSKGIGVTLEARGEAEPVTVRMAEVEQAVWAERTGRNALFTVNRDVLEAYQITAEDLRRKKPVLLKAWQADRLELDLAGRNLVYEKVDGVWQRDGQPVEEDAESEALQEYLKTLEETEAEAVIDEPAAESAYGLDTPQLVASISHDAQESELRVGNRDGELFARDGTSGPVYRMPSNFLGKAEELLQSTEEKPPSSENETGQE